MSRQLSQQEFEVILKNMEIPRGKQLQFLRLHARAKGRAMTMRRMAERVGYKGWQGMNLQYGLLARRIGMLAGVNKPDITLLVEFIPPTSKKLPESISNAEWILVMRENFANALKSVNWI